MKNLTISFFGSSLVSSYWNGAATYYRGIIKALFDKGHKITFYEPDAYDRQKHRDIKDPEYAKSVVYSADHANHVYNVLRSAGESDIIIKASGVGVFDELLENEVLNFTSHGKTVIFWDVDAPATLDRVKSNIKDPFWKLIPQYDLILTYGGGDPVVKAYTELGAQRCIPIYNALDPTTHHPATPEDRFAGKLGFLGNRMPDRETRVWEFFFKPAQSLPEYRFVIGGSGWENHVPQVSNIKYLGHVYTYEHNAFNSSPDTILNISRESMARYGFSPATRVFEAAGAGACIITDYWEGIELFLQPGKECLVVNSGDEVINILKELDKDTAVKIGQAALNRILSEHTYAHRAELLESILAEIPKLKSKVKS